MCIPPNLDSAVASEETQWGTSNALLLEGESTTSMTEMHNREIHELQDEYLNYEYQHIREKSSF